MNIQDLLILSVPGVSGVMETMAESDRPLILSASIIDGAFDEYLFLVLYTADLSQ